MRISTLLGPRWPWGHYKHGHLNMPAWEIIPIIILTILCPFTNEGGQISVSCLYFLIGDSSVLVLCSFIIGILLSYWYLWANSLYREFYLYCHVSCITFSTCLSVHKCDLIFSDTESFLPLCGRKSLSLHVGIHVFCCWPRPLSFISASVVIFTLVEKALFGFPVYRSSYPIPARIQQTEIKLKTANQEFTYQTWID